MIKLFWWSLRLDFQFFFSIAQLPCGEKIRFIWLKYYWFLKCSARLTNEPLHRVRIFGFDYYFPDEYGLASLQRVYCSSHRLREYLPKNPVILDVGANIGQFNFFCRQYLMARRIVSVEPLPFCIDTLRKNSQEDEDCLEYAISSENKPVKIFIDSSSSQLSSCIKDDSKNTGSELVVQGMRLDDLVEKFGVDSVDLLKIDTEGNEFDVLLSGVQTLERTNTVLVEMSIFRKSSGNMFATGGLLQDHGFCLAELFAFSGHHPEDVDGFFMRK